MDSAQSTPSPPSPPPPRRPASPQLTTTLDEKFDAFRIDRVDPISSHSILLSGGGEHISGTKTEQYVQELLKDPRNRLGLSALSSNDPAVVLKNPSAIINDTQYFNVAIPHEGSPVTYQRASGRCWIFAACNVFRIAIQQKYDIKNFELSQAYLFFWDKVEKANYFLESILDTVDEDVDSRLVAALMEKPVGDGGQWDMIVNLVSKYGILPQSLYPDSWNAQNSRSRGGMDALLTTKLRESALRLRALHSTSRNSTLLALKEKTMQDIIRILTLCLGPPPAANAPFTWHFHDTSHKLHTLTTTPLAFATSTTTPLLQKSISLVNDPRNPYLRLLTVSHLGNIRSGRPVTYINVSAPVLKSACIRMLQKGLPVFFGSDSHHQFDRVTGIMDTDLIDYELGFSVTLGMSKAERLMSGESKMTHAMVLTAVHLDGEGKAVRWRVENSWGEDAGEGGYFVMADRWMDEFCYQAIVDPEVVGQEVRDVLGQRAMVLPLWDPMGALA
ncbi:MAG: hypothetical protein Q9195_006638 [Heterodermia aff. obscurata]